MAERLDLLEAHGRIFGSALTAPQKLVGIALLDHWSRKHSEVFPSVSRLARMTSQCERTVKAAIAGLEAAGVVQVKRTQGLSNRYTFVGVMSLHEGTRPKRTRGNRGKRCTSAGDSPVQEMPPTGARDAPAPVQEMPPKEPSEGTKEGTNFRGAKKSRRASKKKENTPHPHAQELKLHYIEEFKRTRGSEPGFGKDWSRAMMALGQLADKVGLEGAKRVITNALGQKATESYRPPVEPWDLVKRCNTFLGTAKKTSSAPQRGMASHIETGVFDV